MKNIILKNAITQAILSSAYVWLIGSFLFYIPKFLHSDKPDTVLAPILMLSLVVFSAALMGVHIFGKPLMWYLDNKKREAITLLTYTLGIFFAITVIILAITYLIL